MRHLLALLCFLIIAPTVTLAQSADTTADDKGYLTSFLERNLSGAGRAVTIDGFAGALSSRATFTRLTIADDSGVWLTITNGAISWSRAALLTGKVDIDELSADEIDLARKPGTSPDGKSVEAGKSFSLPELPVSVRIGKLAAKKVMLGAPILGEAATVSFDGKATLAGGEGSAELTIQRTDGKDGQLALKGDYANATRSGTIDLLAKEGKDGIAVTLLGLPDSPAAQLALHGSGTLDDFSTDLSLSTDNQPRLTGRINLKAPDAAAGAAPAARRFALTLKGDITPLLQPQFRDFFGTSVSVEAEGVDEPGVRTDLTRLVLDSAGVDLSGRLSLSGERQPLAAALTLRLGLPDNSDLRLPVSGTPTYVQAGTLLLRYNAQKGDGWRLSGDLSGFRRNGVKIAATNLDGSGQVQSRTGQPVRIDGSVTFGADGIALDDPALANAVGKTVNGRMDMSWQEGQPFALRNIKATAGDLDLSGTVNLLIQELDLKTTADLQLTAADVGRFSALASRKLGGRAEISLSGQSELVTGAFDVVARAHGSGLSMDQPMVDRLLATTSDITLSAQRDQSGIKIRDLTLKVPALSADLSGSLTSARQDLSGTLAFSDVSALGPGFSGKFDAAAKLSGEIGKRHVELAGTGHGLGVGVATLDPLVGGNSRLAVTLDERNDLFDLTSANFAGPGLTATASPGAGPGAYEVAAKLKDIGQLADGISGPVTASGTIVRSAAGYRVDLGSKGPGGTDLRISGDVAADFGTADLAMSGQSQSALLNPIIVPRSVSGPVRFDLTLAGKPALSSLRGRIEATGLKFVSPAERLSIGNGTISATIDGGRAVLDGSAKIRGGGSIALSGPVSMEAPFAGDLVVTFDNARLRDPGLYDTSIDGRVTIRGPVKGGAVIGGAITLRETEISVAPLNLVADLPPVRHVAASAPVRATLARAGATDGTGPKTAPTVFGLDLTVNAPARLFVRGRGLDAEMGGSIHLGGTTANVAPSGSFDLLRGRLNLLGKRFVLDEGLVQLMGSMVPYLNFTASADTFGTTTTIVLEGLATKPQLHFSSSANLPEDEVLSQLLFGNGLDNMSAFQLAQLANAIATLTGKGSDSILVKLRKKTKLDALDVVADDQGNTAIQVGKYLNDNLYSETTVGGDGTAKIDLDLDINRDLSVRGTLGSEGQSGVGVYYTKDY